MFLTPFLFIYCNNNITGIKLHNDCNNVVYLASVVLSNIWVCTLEDHMIGKPVYIIAYPVQNFSVPTSLGYLGLCQFPQELASENTSKLLMFLGSK